MMQSPSHEVYNHSSVKKFSTFYETRMFIVTFTKAYHWTPSQASWIQSTLSHRICLRSVLILFSHPHLCLLRSFFPSGFLTKILYAFLIPPIHANCPFHLIIFDLIILIIFGERCKLWSSLLCNSLHSFYSSLLGPNILPYGKKLNFIPV
jgi:hypothetical protein